MSETFSEETTCVMKMDRNSFSCHRSIENILYMTKFRENLIPVPFQ